MGGGQIHESKLFKWLSHRRHSNGGGREWNGDGCMSVGVGSQHLLRCLKRVSGTPMEGRKLVCIHEATRI